MLYVSLSWLTLSSGNLCVCVRLCVDAKKMYTLQTDTKLRIALGKRRDKAEVIFDSSGLNVRLSIRGGVTFFYRIAERVSPSADYRGLSVDIPVTGKETASAISALDCKGL